MSIVEIAAAILLFEGFTSNFVLKLFMRKTEASGYFEQNLTVLQLQSFYHSTLALSQTTTAERALVAVWSKVTSTKLLYDGPG